MLRTRVITGLILGALLLLGLFELPRFWAAAAFGIVFLLAAWEWAGFGLLRGAAARLGYTAGVASVLLLSWRWSGDSTHLIMLLGAACL